MNKGKLPCSPPRSSGNAAEHLPQPGEDGPAEHQRTPFIPAWLDEAGLTPAQFRVLCHVARRGECFDALPTFARCCRMERETVQRALKHLAALGKVTKEERKWDTNIYRLADSGKDGLLPQRQRRANPHPKRRATIVAAKTGYKGSPYEGSPSKGQPRFQTRVIDPRTI